ncbi:MAG TPA: class I SAM-dependent methyltransferase [Acetobacteraceae bacterium]|jgi:ubiquinone/menaquinone biosynthesis C-methylase UbiE|nr:class I SAM-dependent methyltransferase [Acetobacteraceae bacterium]
MPSTFINRGAAAYDSQMGRWSRRLAPQLIAFAGLAAGERILDVGCGTGSLTFALAANTDIGEIEAIDYEAQFVAAVNERNVDPRVTVRQADATALPFPDGRFDRALSLLVLQFIAGAARAVAEMRRVVRPGGIAAAAVWDTYGGMPHQRMIWDTAAAIDPSAAAGRAKAAFRPMTQPGDLHGAFATAGFVGITETLLTIRMDFSDFDDYWRPLQTGQGTLGDFLASLPDHTRQRVEAAVRNAYLCGRPDGPRSFAASAWAVRGRVPS